jgi:hypothetical protein
VLPTRPEPDLNSLYDFFTSWKAHGDGTRCFYCGISLLFGSNIPESHPHFKTKDHFVPKSRRKLFAAMPTPIQNMSLIVASCSACNNIKSNRTPEFLRGHVRKMNEGNDVFFAEALLGITFRSMPDYLAYCRAANKATEVEKVVMTKRSMEAVAQRRAAGLLPPANHKEVRRRAMQENVWWNAMNALGKLIFVLQQHGGHPEVSARLREDIGIIKSTLPEQFSRRNLAPALKPTISEGTILEVKDVEIKV